MPTYFNLINRQLFGPSGDCCSSELDKKQPNDIKRNVPLSNRAFALKLRF